MDFNINYNYDSVDPLKWSDRSHNQNLFINYNFLKLFSKFHPSIIHLFIQNGKIEYLQIFLQLMLKV